jgi:hypothetical protein
MREMPLPREKMKHFEISRLLPTAIARPYTYEFVDFLATQFKRDVTNPEEFLLNIELAFTDLRKGTNAFTGDLIRHRAVDRVPAVEVLIRRDLASVIDALFSPEDAAAIKQCKAGVLAEAATLQPAFDAARRKEQERMVAAHLKAINSPQVSSRNTGTAKKKVRIKKAKKKNRSKK